jgi:serine/threonine protein phosphatase PrpC
VLAGIAQEAGMTIRAFHRESNEDVMAAFLTDGKKKVPVFAVFDGGREVARWIERPAVAEAIVQRMRQSLPPPDDPEREAKVRAAREQMTRDLEAARAQDEVVREVRAAIARGLGLG